MENIYLKVNVILAKIIVLHVKDLNHVLNVRATISCKLVYVLLHAVLDII